MDIQRFKDSKTGKLVPIKILAGPDHAFIPDPLPPAWSFPERLWPKLADAKEALGRLDGIGRTLPNPELLLMPLRRREALTSSRMEGTYAAAEELMLFELSPHDPKSAHDQANSWREVFNYSEALRRGLTLLEELPFCGRLFKELHGILMQGVRGQRSTPGEWRDLQVAIGSDRRYIPPPAVDLPECLGALEKFINSELPDYDPLVRAFLVHYQLEAIHPFTDGNGRIGRVVLSLMIAKWCNHIMPWLYLSPFFERWKDEYVDNMFKISTEGGWEKWIEFCLNATIAQANDAIVRCEKLRKLKTEMENQIGTSGSTRTRRIIDGLFSIPVVRVSDLRKELDISYPTAQADVDHLVALGILATLSETRPKSYYAPQIFAIAYAEIDGV